MSKEANGSAAKEESGSADETITNDNALNDDNQDDSKTEEEDEDEQEKDDNDENGNNDTESGVNGNGDGSVVQPKLFVGRLPSGVKEFQLKRLFSTYGEVTHCDIVGKYGFVVCYYSYIYKIVYWSFFTIQHMKNQEEANEAMNKMNNYNFNGSTLTVQVYIYNDIF